MKKISEYRLHEECRLLGQRPDSPGHRDRLLTMAATWDALADGRKRTLAQKGSLESNQSEKAAQRAAWRLDGIAATATASPPARAQDEKAG